MEVVKVTTKRYKVVDAASSPFISFGKFRDSRKRIGLSVERKCFNCNHKFEDNEDIYLVMLEGTHNRLFCKKCNDLALLDLPNHGGEK